LPASLAGLSLWILCIKLELKFSPIFAVSTSSEDDAPSQGQRGAGDS
jgi:hypothetical protein